MDATQALRSLPPEFFVVHRDLPREGPGCEAATLKALRLLPALPAAPRVFDLGCGPGAQTLVLARALGSRVVAVDLHRPFLEQLEGSARQAGLAHLIEARCADFGDLGEEPSSIDLIWCESAAFIIGFAESIRCWRPLLKAGGLMAVTNAVWLVDDPPAEAVAHWAGDPSIATVRKSVRAAESEGMRLIETFQLGPEAWWEYYTPLRRRVEDLRARATLSPALAQVLDETEREIAGFERNGDSFGYQFFLMQKMP
ncbi:MAG TPA: class I SAM-dependent methyltransferase [Myxococcales bacterium]|nr:class I SAM-dependent methyltransferase [Myxococcales bacterium]